MSRSLKSTDSTAKMQAKPPRARKTSARALPVVVTMPLGVPPATRISYEEIARGFAARSVKKLIDNGVLDIKYVHRIIPPRTFRRRLAKDAPLKKGEGDAVARLVRVSQMAKQTFGD